MNLKYNISSNLSDADKVFKIRVAACMGYASLLKYFCDGAGIECSVVDGYTKVDIMDINSVTKPNHSWNIVKIDGQWYLSDVTFASLKEYNGKNVYDFDETYFLCNPDDFSLNHFPEDNKYLLLSNQIRKGDFLKWPIFYSAYFQSGLDINRSTMAGIVGKNLTIEFLNFVGDPTRFHLSTAEDAFFPKVIHIKNSLILKFHSIKTKKKEVLLYYNDKAIMGFKKNSISR